MNGNRKWMMRILGGFLGVMAAATVISRAAASVLVAQVDTEKAGRGRLTYSFEGNGTVVPAKENRIFLWPGQQVEWTAQPGSAVKAGECLVQFRMEYLQQTIEKKQAELKQLELQASQQQVSAREQARVPMETGAAQTLLEAQRQLETARQKEAAAQAAYQQFMADGGGSEYGAETPQDNGGGIGAGAGTGGRSETGNGTGAGPEFGAGSIDSGGSISDYGQAAGNVWLTKEQELSSALKEAQAGVESAVQAVNQAQNAYELAKEEDAAQSINAANAAEAARLGAASTEVQAESARKELELLCSYQAAGGRICADADCTVLTTGVQSGTVTTGSEVFVTGNGGFRLKGLVNAEDKEKLKAGAEIEIQLGAGKKKSVKIESIGTDTDAAGGAGGDNGQTEGGTGMGDGAGTEDHPSSSAQAFWLAALPENVEVQNRDSFTWNAEIPSEKEYDQIIPLGALREDVGETYCLVLAEEEQVIGTVKTAKKVPVTVLEKDAKNAAVTSTLSSSDQIIVSSEKYVAKGDRVRLKE